MDSEINRWRNIATSEIFIHPQQKVVLTSRRRGKVPKSTITARLSPHLPKRNIESLGHILDRFGEQQKRNVTTLCSGHLNPNQANQHLERFIDMHKPLQKFCGKVPKTDKEFPAISIPSGHSAMNESHPTTHDDQRPAPKLLNDPFKSDTSCNSLDVGNMIDLLGKFDMVKLRDKDVDTSELPLPIDIPELIPQNSKPVRQFIPSYQLNLTKVDQFKTFQHIDTSLVERSQSYLRNADNGKLNHLQKYFKYIEKELDANHCPSKGPDFKRLMVYSECFEKLIMEFKTYAPLLAEIKHEYDKTVLSFQGDQNELNFLRTKVQKLLSQNENRLLLKFERKKAKELEMQVNSLLAENDKLKSELRRKLAIYASYIPASIFYEKKKSDSLLAEVESQIKHYDVGEDPITVSERQVEILKKDIESKVEKINDMKRIQDLEFVPRITKEKIEETVREIEEKLKKCIEKNDGLETRLSDKQSHIRQLENTLREKEQQYQFLITEYNELSEAVASSLNKKSADDLEQKIKRVDSVKPEPEPDHELNSSQSNIDNSVFDPNLVSPDNVQKDAIHGITPATLSNDMLMPVVDLPTLTGLEDSCTI
ncbi:hypothetical protein BDV3_006197 [Batrachochytrium dendrobatidis]|uniref:Translin-associated factor X-interacting protein 1 N-terminal domain-containing protein n=1 Tax=Batrachochytrium dendrobatidis (strain JEL423) TaxID=403673 RepID=A0A177WP00_BATDL|nr:hypothetical protein BDEG_25019 [Batrachochytrium dendrobatidis JEL423]